MTSGAIPFILHFTGPCYLSFVQSHKFPGEKQQIDDSDRQAVFGRQAKPLKAETIHCSDAAANELQRRVPSQPQSE